MPTESTHPDAGLPARRRIVALSERKVALPIAVIAHDSEQRDALEAQIGRVRPVVTFPSLAHFGGDAVGRERWAGIVVARSHAWDARLDTCVPRRAFIALYGLVDEGHGWPEAVKRIGSADELETWLSAVSGPVLPPEDRVRDRPRATKPRSKSSIFTMSLAGEPVPVSTQLALPVPSVASATVQLRLPVIDVASPAVEEVPTPGSPKPKASKPKPARPARPAKSVVTVAKVTPPIAEKSRTERKSERPALSAQLSTKQGLRLTSNDAQEQAVIDAVRQVGAASARAIIDAMERFNRL